MNKNDGFSLPVLTIKFVLVKVCNGGSKAGSKQLRNNGLYEHKRKQNWIFKYVSFTLLLPPEHKTIPNEAVYRYFVVKVAFCKQNI